MNRRKNVDDMTHDGVCLLVVGTDGFLIIIITYHIPLLCSKWTNFNDYFFQLQGIIYMVSSSISID